MVAAAWGAVAAPSGCARPGRVAKAGGPAVPPSARRLRQGAGGVGLQEGVVEGTSECGLQPQEQLDALEAAESDLALQGGGGGHGLRGAGAAELLRQRAHDVEHARFDLRRERRPREERRRESC